MLSINTGLNISHATRNNFCQPTTFATSHSGNPLIQVYFSFHYFNKVLVLLRKMSLVKFYFELQSMSKMLNSIDFLLPHAEI